MARHTTKSLTSEIRIAEEMAKYYADPYGFVMAAYPWGQKGADLENDVGPTRTRNGFCWI